MNEIIKSIIEIAIPIFNAYICVFGIIGIYTSSGGKMSDRVGFMCIPILIAMIYGAYIGYMAVENVNRKSKKDGTIDE